MGIFQGLGEIFGQMIIYIYIWIAVVIIITVVLLALISKYKQYKKNDKTEADDRNRMIFRICIYLVLGILIFAFSPLILGLFL